MKHGAAAIALLLVLSTTAFADEKGASGESYLTQGVKVLDSVAADIEGEKLSEPAQVDVMFPRFSLGLGGGYFSFRDEVRDVTLGDIEVGRGGFGYIQFQIEVPPYLALGAAFGIAWDSDESSFGELTLLQYPLDLFAKLFLVSEGAFRPFFFGGLGWYFITWDFDDATGGGADFSETDNGFALFAGVGLEFALPGDVVRFEIRFVYRFLEDAKLRDSGSSIGADRWDISVGINFGI